MRVGTYNVLIPRVDRANKDQESWEHRKSEVVDTIDSNFDLIGLQECSTVPTHGQANYLVEELEARGWAGYYPWESKLFEDEFHERLPIFWRSELYTPLETGQLLLSGWTEEELSEVPILEARYASFVKLQTADGSVLWFYTLHLQHQTVGASYREALTARFKRERAQKAVADHIRSHVLDGESVVLAGDFNTPTTSSVLYEVASLENIVHRAESVQNWSFNSFHDWSYPQDGQHIDHVLFAGSVSVLEAAMVQSGASDHHPVRAIVKFP